jgi:hypothetical protein
MMIVVTVPMVQEESEHELKILQQEHGMMLPSAMAVAQWHGLRQPLDRLVAGQRHERQPPRNLRVAGLVP